MKQQEKGRGKLDIRVLFTLAAIAEILGTLLIATLLTALLENLLHEAIEVHPLVWLLLFGTTIGLTAATVVNVLLLRPVVRLSRAMKQVASGNFAVRLATNSVINEIADSYDSFNRMVEALGETETLKTIMPVATSTSRMLTVASTICSLLLENNFCVPTVLRPNSVMEPMMR